MAPEGRLFDMSPIRMSRVETAIRIVLEYNEAFNRQDIAGIMRLVSDDCLFEDNAPAPDGTLYKGKKAVEQFWHDIFSRSPTGHIDIEEIFSFSDRCIMRWRYSRVDAEGAEGHVRGADIFRVRDGLICEKFSYVKG